jgi:hypothetical protein
MKQIVYDLVAWTWCFPQQLLGCIVRFFLLTCKAKPKIKSWYKIYEVNPLMAVTLGQYIIIPKIFPAYKDKNTTILHEMGHVKQSYMLGPLYLLIVGLPSIIFNIISQVSPSFANNYYKRFPENWSDRLGNVKR